MSFVKLATLRDISRSQSISDTSSCASNASECSNLTASSATSSSEAATSASESKIKSQTASETEASESSASSNLLNHHNTSTTNNHNCSNNKINRNHSETSSLSHNSSIHNNNNSHTNHNNNNNNSNTNINNTNSNSNNSSAIKKIITTSMTATNTTSSTANKFLNNTNKHNSNATTTTTESSSLNSGGESSDPLESDFSENDLEEDIPNVDDIEHDRSDVKQQLANASADNDEDDDDKEYELDDFQIIKTIGTGTFGRVCLCRDKNINKFLAMKILAMADVIRLKQVEHVKNEKNILAEIQHPFIVNLLWFTKDECCLYMLFEYVCGGELFSYLRNAGRFSSPTANFYACEITQALEYLHSLSIVYRDLKPENLLIDRDGHLKITDFGFAKKLKDRTWTLCGTPEYLAPEIIQSKGHNKAVDWWALGVLIYEMLVGYPPFYDDNPFGIYEKILSGKIEWPRHMDPIAKDLVKKLLVQDRTKRLGNMKNGSDDIKRHRWFKHLDWEDVKNKKLRPPIMPRVHFDGDTSNFDEYPETDWKAVRSLDSVEIKLFEDF